MQIDAQKLNDRFKNAYPAGVPNDLVELMRDRLDIGLGDHVRRDVQRRRDNAYQRASELYSQTRDIEKKNVETAARAAELQRQIDQADPLTVTPAQAGAMLAELSGCELILTRIANSLPQVEAEKAKADTIQAELSELATIATRLTTHRLQMDLEARAELLADVLTDAERRRILEAPAFLAKKQAEAEQARNAAEAAERAKERAAQPAPTAAEMHPAIAAETSALALAELVFGSADPYSIKSEIMSRDSQRWPMVRLRLAPAWQYYAGDAEKSYALQRLVNLVESGQR